MGGGGADGGLAGEVEDDGHWFAIGILAPDGLDDGFEVGGRAGGENQLAGVELGDVDGEGASYGLWADSSDYNFRLLTRGLVLQARITTYLCDL